MSLKNEMSAVDRRPESTTAVFAQTQETACDDLAIVKRLVEAYRRTDDKEQKDRGHSMWRSIFTNLQKPIHKIFLRGTIDKAADVLRYPHRSDLFYGFDNLTASLQPAFAAAAAQQDQANVCIDSLLRFAEAIGAIPLENPVQYYPPTRPWQADAIIEKLNKALGVQLVFPNPYPQEQGILTSYGIMSYRVPQALYQAYRLKQMVDGKEHPRVLEIGAGLGRTAYYARLLGIKDYTIVDLPFTAISSGYFLGRTLGAGHVVLSGESATNSQDCVKFLTPAEFLASTETYDVILNADGFTEMELAMARAYWRHIEKAAPLFLSINHEANSYTVKTLIGESDRVAKVIRYPYWMRSGYVEEVVQFK